jgi:hypothetical protein
VSGGLLLVSKAVFLSEIDMLVLFISIVAAAAIALEIRRTIIKWRAVEKDGWIQMILWYRSSFRKVCVVPQIASTYKLVVEGRIYSCEDPTAQIQFIHIHFPWPILYIQSLNTLLITSLQVKLDCLWFSSLKKKKKLPCCAVLCELLVVQK